MVYQNDPLRLCHKMPAKHQHYWHELLEEFADEILYKHEHPIRYFFKKFLSKFKD